MRQVLCLLLCHLCLLFMLPLWLLLLGQRLLLCRWVRQLLRRFLLMLLRLVWGQLLLLQGRAEPGTRPRGGWGHGRAPSAGSPPSFLASRWGPSPFGRESVMANSRSGIVALARVGESCPYGSGACVDVLKFLLFVWGVDQFFVGVRACNGDVRVVEDVAACAEGEEAPIGS